MAVQHTPIDSWPASAEGCSLEEFRAIIEHLDPVDHQADEVAGGVVIYQAESLRRRLDSGDQARIQVHRELANVLADGPGALVIRDAVDVGAVDRASDAFRTIIDQQKRSGEAGGDHFAEAGANDRIWNALEKLALAAPAVFVDYYASDMVALAAEAWLGPAYQMSSQVNVINPGGKAQQPHRDYHLGFMTEQQAARFPSRAHLLSPALTLQGAVAHGDIPVASGPTKLLPGSQLYAAGYLAWRRPDFVDYFEEHHVQLPLASGDALFFNPALFHAGGSNQTTDVRRMANLLQISSCMGRAMEDIDRRAMSLAIYPELLDRLAAGVSRADIDRAIAASAEGYPFPGDLDADQPVDGLTPPSQADRVARAVDEGWTVEQLAAELR